MVLEDVFSDENLEEAFESFADKHDSHGLDGENYQNYVLIGRQTGRR